MQGLCLVDWGRGIDLHLFPDNTEFKGDCRTSGFRCIEMQQNKPWKFQASLKTSLLNWKKTAFSAILWTNLKMSPFANFSLYSFHQVDTYGLCVIVHLMLHNSYMEIQEKASSDGGSICLPKSSFRRYSHYLELCLCENMVLRKAQKHWVNDIVLMFSLIYTELV